MLRILPFNLAAAALVIMSGMIETDWSWLLLLSPAALYVIVSLFNTGEGFALDAGHFVERHGLLLIIVLGEIIIAVGSGFGACRPTASDLAALLLSVALVAALWWSYFDRDDERAEHRMLQADNRRRTRIALFGFNGAHLFMIAGLILVAAGLKTGIGAVMSADGAGHGEAGAHGSEVILLYGLSLYLAADAAFRAIVRLDVIWTRLIAAAVFLALALLFQDLHGLLLLGTSLALLLIMLASEALLPSHRAADGEGWGPNLPWRYQAHNFAASMNGVRQVLAVH